MRNLLMLSVLLISCTGSAKRESNHEAIMLHNSMLKKMDLIRNHLNQLSDDSLHVNHDSVKILQHLIQVWEADLVEVPGNKEHATHKHNHLHQLAPDVTAEQMISIQKELDARLAAIGRRASALKPDSTHDEHVH